MSDKKKSSGKIKSFFLALKKLLTFNIATIVFGALLLYMIITVVLYATASHVTSYQVTAGPLTKNPVCTGLALRSEQVVSAGASGYVEYYAREGMEVRKDGSVYALRTEKQKTKTVELTEEQLAEIRSGAAKFSYGFNSDNFYDTYSYKYEIQGTILQAAVKEEEQEETTYQQETEGDTGDAIQEDTGSDRDQGTGDVLTGQAVGKAVTVGDQDIYTAPEDGLILYSTDGYENKTPENLTEGDFNEKSYQKTNLIQDKKIDKGDPVYKVVTSEKWTLMVPLTDKMAATLADRESIQVKFTKDGESQNGSLSIVTIGDQKVARIDLINGMSRYASDRFLEVELVINTQSGLKIPVSSIVEKEFYTIPREFLTKGNNDGSEGFIREVRSGSTSSSEFVEAVIYRQVDGEGKEITSETQDSTGGLCYVDRSTFKEGDVLKKPDSGETYTVGKTGKLQGVYNMNKGYAVFRQIEILDQNEEYCIVAQGTSYGLQAFDYIVMDGSTVKEEEILYSGGH